MLNKQTIGTRIQNMINANGLSKRGLAKIIHVTPNTISGYINGRRLPDVDKLCLLAAQFGCSLDYLTGLSDSPDICRISLSADEHHLLENYRKTDPAFRKILEEFSDNLTLLPEPAAKITSPKK